MRSVCCLLAGVCAHPLPQQTEVALSLPPRLRMRPPALLQPTMGACLGPQTHPPSTHTGRTGACGPRCGLPLPPWLQPLQRPRPARCAAAGPPGRQLCCRPVGKHGGRRASCLGEQHQRTAGVCGHPWPASAACTHSAAAPTIPTHLSRGRAHLVTRCRHNRGFQSQPLRDVERIAAARDAPQQPARHSRVCSKRGRGLAVLRIFVKSAGRNIHGHYPC